MINSTRNHEIEDLFNIEDITWSEIESSLKDSEELHHAIDLYNWDDGFEFPTLVLNRQDCDLGTILLMFEMIDQDPNDPQFSFEDYEVYLKIFLEALLNKWKSKTYLTNISYNGSPGEELIVEWKRRYSHYEVYPDEK